MTYKQITPVEDWFFSIPPQLDGPPALQTKELVVWRLAAWALQENGDVIGLVSVEGGGPDEKIMSSVCRLVAVPPLRGTYKHDSELTGQEREALLKGGVTRTP